MLRNKTKSPAPKKHRKRRIAAALFLVLCLILAGLWFQRYALIESFARHKIAQMGYNADFTVTHISGEHLEIEDIRLSRGGDSFFSARAVEASYAWREAIEGQLISLSLTAPSVSVAIDESGNIVSDWLSQSSAQESSNLDLPRDGITITQGTVKLQSPYGQFETRLDADIKTLSNIKATLTAPPQPVSYEGVNTVLGGTVTAALIDTNLDVTLDLAAPKFNGDALSGSGLSVKGQIKTNTQNLRKNVLADLRINFDNLAAQAATTGQGQLLWSGRLSLPDPEGSKPLVIGDWANGDFSLALNALTLQNAERVQQIAKTLTLNETLSGISSAAPFAPALTQEIEEFLGRLDIQSAGRVVYNGAKTNITLSQPLIIKGGKETLTLTPKPDVPFYTFDPYDAVHKAAFDADFTGRHGLHITDANLTAVSDDAFALKAFSGDFQTKRTWRARTPAGRPARLAPLSARVAYEAEAETRTVKASGAIDFDGDVPGGYGQGLKARGTLGLMLEGEALTARFTATKNRPVTVARLETSSDWIITDGTFTLARQDLIYDRNPRRSSGRTLTTKLVSGTGTLLHSLDGRDLTFSFADTDVKGDLGETQQDWTIGANTVQITSDTFPSPGTDIRGPVAQITASLTPDHPITFTIDAPVTSVKTELVKAANLAVKASGSTQDLYVTYGNGLIKFSAGELPILPLEGDVRYNGAAWAGDAVTFLPGAKLSPIDVSYTFKDGRGEADVTITDLPFKPGKLQPKNLVPAIAGKVSRVDGLVSAKVHVEFGTGQPLTSSGTATITNMNTGTLPGPVTGMNANLSFSSLFPVMTAGIQTLNIDKFDPGFPLSDGEVMFEIVKDGIKIHSAKWPMGSGFISLEPTTWLYSSPQNRVVLAVENVSIGEFLKDMGGGNIKATGDVNGRLPVLIEGINVRVEDGRLAVDNGGVIQYSSPQTNIAGNANEYAGYAFDALENFEYEQLEAVLNGALDGPMKLRMIFNGANPDVLYGSEFKFNIGIEGELLNILRSFQNNNGISSQIMDQIKASSPQKTPTPNRSDNKP